MIDGMTITRRALVGGMVAATAAAQQRKQPVEWKPRFGVLGPYSEANVRFAKEEGFTNMILGVSRRSTLDPATINDQQIEAARQTLAKYGMGVSAFQATQNHIAADPEKRRQDNDYFVKVIELAGKMGVPYVGTASGKDPEQPLAKQVEQIVRVYNERYFPACQQHKVRILWEPWPGGPNVATSPVGFDALFRGFGDSPHVGLQYDPSHLVWQMMDPIQTARDFVDKIYDVHLKDTEVRWDVLKRGGINPVDKAEWWSYRLPGLGSIDWAAFFTVLQRAGYQGAMSLEHEDPLYGSPNRGGPDFSADYKMGFKMAHRYLRQYVPE
jgi:sugar phosphate isomerase/epimerase